MSWDEFTQQNNFQHKVKIQTELKRKNKKMFNCIKCNYKVRYFISIFFSHFFLKINGGWHFTGDIIMDIYKKNG